MKVFFVRHAETLANKSQIMYNNDQDDPLNKITEKGQLQAIHTGKYLKQFGKFDLIISSPKIRCIQTANLIAKEINYKKEIITNDLIQENVGNEMAGKTDADFKKNTKIDKLVNKIKKEKDPFKKLKLTPELMKILYPFLWGDNWNDVINNIKKFLNQLKKIKKKCILIVTHGGFVDWIEGIITNTIYNDIFIISKNNKCVKPSYYQNGNTKIMACILENNNYTLVIPQNTLHLENCTF